MGGVIKLSVEEGSAQKTVRRGANRSGGGAGANDATVLLSPPVAEFWSRGVDQPNLSCNCVQPAAPGPLKGSFFKYSGDYSRRLSGPTQLAQRPPPRAGVVGLIACELIAPG